MRAVLDPNVIVSAVLSRDGTPAKVFQAWLDGAFELVACRHLLSELERVLAYPKIARRLEPAEAAELVSLLRQPQVAMFDDPQDPPAVRSPDPDDDYLIALAGAAQAAIVSGDSHLHSVADYVPVYTPAAFLALLLDAS